MLAAAGALVAAVSGARADEPSAPDGAALFKQNGCFACHGDMGEGGAGPRFVGDPMLAIDQYVAAQILIGRGIMPSFARKLTDQQIAAVASFVRTSWGNDFGPVSPKAVTETRALMDRALAPTGARPRPASR
jgi:mono/diheme cytochrome c family protein